MVYVDDIVAAAKSLSELDWFYKRLSKRFKAKNLEEINKILRVRVVTVLAQTFARNVTWHFQRASLSE